MATAPSNSNKQSAPSRKSVFERQKEEAEAKKAREKAETAAVYEDFVKSFDDDGTSPASTRGKPHAAGFSSTVPGPGKRHFTGSGMKSGPGSLGPSPHMQKRVPGSIGPAFGRKRGYDEPADRRDRDYRYSHDDRESNDDRAAMGRQDQDRHDEDEKAARPTVYLSSLPPGTSPAVIKALFTPSSLAVENVRILPGSTADRKALSAIVTLAAETAATDIDTMVSHMQNKYLGFGFNLSLSRHLSSAALSGTSALNLPGSNMNSLPFGARSIQQQTSLSRAPPPGQGRNYAPPQSYTSSTSYGSRPQTQVAVQPPSDLKQLKLIHKTLEALLTYGPEFEALLMSRPQIQREEKWSWLWNSRSQGGVYYRWRLWQVLTDTDVRGRRPIFGGRQGGDTLFEGHSLWLPPEEHIRFEYTTRMDEFVSDEDYNSSDEEGEDDGGGLARRHHDHNASGLTQDLGEMNDGLGYLNPLAKAKLTHLLTRLPEANTKLRKGDVARITSFAIEHAGAGADEVASLITRNVLQPFGQQSKTESDENIAKDTILATATDQSQKDTSAASIVGLYIISDILSSSASSGVRHAWRYRQLFETALGQQKVFEKLGRLDRDLNWGKLKAEKWKRSVQNLLQQWEGWCVFPQTSHDEMVNHFLNPPLSHEEQKRLDAEEKRKTEEEASRKKAGQVKWRSVEVDNQGGDVTMSEAGVDGREMVDDEEEDEEDEDMDVDEAALVDATVDGLPLADSSDEEMVDNPPSVRNEEPLPVQQKDPKSLPTSTRRQRPRATDMFADDST